MPSRVAKAGTMSRDEIFDWLTMDDNRLPGAAVVICQTEEQAGDALLEFRRRYGGILCGPTFGYRAVTQWDQEIYFRWADGLGLELPRSACVVFVEDKVESEILLKAKAVGDA